MRILICALVSMVILAGCSSEQDSEYSKSRFGQPQKSEETSQSPTGNGSRKLDKMLEKAYENNAFNLD